MSETKIISDMDKITAEEKDLIHYAKRILNINSKKEEYTKYIPADGLWGDHSYTLYTRTYKNHFLKIIEKKYSPHTYKGSVTTTIFLRRARNQGITEKIASLLPLYDLCVEIQLDENQNKYFVNKSTRLDEVSDAIVETFKIWSKK